VKIRKVIKTKGRIREMASRTKVKVTRAILSRTRIMKAECQKILKMHLR
jgi:hypothetical protein